MGWEVVRRCGPTFPLSANANRRTRTEEAVTLTSSASDKNYDRRHQDAGSSEDVLGPLSHDLSPLAVVVAREVASRWRLECGERETTLLQIALRRHNSGNTTSHSPHFLKTIRV